MRTEKNEFCIECKQVKPLGVRFDWKFIDPFICSSCLKKANLKLSKVSETYSASLRWKVMERDGHKCVKCGRSAEDGVTLHVDHVFPKSKGGMATLENGQTLCDECNLGKGARVPETHPTQHALDAATAARLPSTFSAEAINPAMGQGATRRAQ